jgi:hypothetical protein
MQGQQNRVFLTTVRRYSILDGYACTNMLHRALRSMVLFEFKLRDDTQSKADLRILRRCAYMSYYAPLAYPERLCMKQGCRTLNAATPNPSFICIILKRTPERWAAWSLSSAKREDVSLKITTTGAPKDMYTAAVKKALRLKMAALTFVNTTLDDVRGVALKVSVTVMTFKHHDLYFAPITNFRLIKS